MKSFRPKVKFLGFFTIFILPDPQELLTLSISLFLGQPPVRLIHLKHGAYQGLGFPERRHSELR